MNFFFKREPFPKEMPIIHRVMRAAKLVDRTSL